MNFQVGMPRSGTDFFNHLLNSSGKVASIHEHLLSLTGFQALASARDFYEGKLSMEDARELVRCYQLRSEIPIDSNYLVSWLLPPVLAEYPDAKFVHLVRDPRDNIRSCYNELDCYGDFWHKTKTQVPFIQWILKNHKPWFYLMMREFDLTRPRIKRADWDSLTRFEKTCAYWTETHRLVLSSLSNHKHYLRVRLEDLGKSPEIAAKVLGFYELPVPSMERLGRVIATPVNSADSPLWATVREIKKAQGVELLPKEFSQWPKSQQETLRRMCGDMAATFGYQI